MLHYDSRDYRVAVGETARRFQAELDATIHAGQASALSVIERVQREIPEDRIVSGQTLRFEPNRGGVLVQAPNDFSQPLHRHALGQLAERAGVPDLFVSRLLEKDYGTELLADNFNTIFARETPRRFLLRSVGGQVRGWVSQSYRRMDSRPILDSFARACNEVGAVPIEGVGGELRFCIRAILPIVFQPGGEEVLAFGVELSNSDFGCGALSLRTFTIRIYCSNYARLEEELRKVHLGGRLNDSIEFSQRTYELDTEAMASATRDVVVSSLSPAKVNGTVALIERAMTEKVEFRSALGQLPKMGLLRSEVEAVRATFLDGGIEMLPPGQNLYRMAQAVAWVAKSADKPERRLELECVAGQMLLAKKERAATERVAA